MRVLGLDLGEKTIGVAVSDPLGLTAQGITVVQRRDLDQELKELQEIIESYRVETIVMGLPKNMDGSCGPQAKKAEDYAALLQEYFRLPVVFWDERLTTVAAEKTLLDADVSRGKRRKVIDKMAAALILQGYLDRRGMGNP